MKTNFDIVKAAEELYAERDKYCYFYGAKGVLLDDNRMNALWNAEPNYFKRYTAEQKKAIFDYSRGKIGLDCSGFVCSVLERAGVITRSQWTYSTALISRCTSITTNTSKPDLYAGSLMYSTFHNAGRHIGVSAGSDVFYDIAAEGDTIRRMSISDWGKWEKAGNYQGVSYSHAAPEKRFDMPEGYLDVVDTKLGKICGWAYDGTDEILSVHIYITGVDNSFKQIIGTNAMLFRGDLKDGGKGNGYHAFNHAYDFSQLKNGTYEVSAYAINKNAGGVNPKLTGVKTIKIDTEYKPWVGKATTLVNVRSYAGSSFTNLEACPMLGTGNLVDVIGEVKDSAGVVWYKVRIAQKHIGYVHSNYIRKA